MTNNWQTKIERIECTTFPKTKVCIFIFVSFKNASDCIIIETPLKEISPEIIGMIFNENSFDNSLQPRVISTIPYNIPCVSFAENPSFSISGASSFVRKENTFNEHKSSLIK